MLNKNRKNGDFAMGSPKTKGKLNNQFDEQIKATAQSITRRAALKKVRHRPGRIGTGGLARCAWRDSVKKVTNSAAAGWAGTQPISGAFYLRRAIRLGGLLQPGPS
jgi:hypothetical protein